MNQDKHCPQILEKPKNFSDTIDRQKKLGQKQRDYKKALGLKPKSRRDAIKEAGHTIAIEQLVKEKDDLRAQIWTAQGSTHSRYNQRLLQQIKCHVLCQEEMNGDISKLKKDIVNLEREISRVGKQIYQLNLQTLPEAQQIDYTRRARKQQTMLENQLEVSIRRECSFAAENAALREELMHELNFRANFNDAYTKLVNQLNTDKKYLIELIDYAISTFDSCIDVHDKVEHVHRTELRESAARRLEMQSVLCKIAANDADAEFLEKKCKMRALASMDPKELHRRDRFRREHSHKISLYNTVLSKIMALTDESNIEAVIAKFQDHESLYYSYFSYSNEMSYHMTLLNNTVNSLYRDISNLKEANQNTQKQQMHRIEHLQKQIRHSEEKYQKLREQSRANDEHVETLLKGVGNLFKRAGCDPEPLLQLLGDHTRINRHNLFRFLQQLENRVINVLASVYSLERQTDKRPFGDFTVRQVEKICEWPTDLDDIVLTQQCAECAEGEALNMEDVGDSGVPVLTRKEARHKLYEKINQPEMQYRLHSISNCRLPRSRVLVSKRNG